MISCRLADKLLFQPTGRFKDDAVSNLVEDGDSFVDSFSCFGTTVGLGQLVGATAEPHVKVVKRQAIQRVTQPLLHTHNTYYSGILLCFTFYYLCNVWHILCTNDTIIAINK